MSDHATEHRRPRTRCRDAAVTPEIGLHDCAFCWHLHTQQSANTLCACFAITSRGRVAHQLSPGALRIHGQTAWTSLKPNRRNPKTSSLQFLQNFNLRDERLWHPHAPAPNPQGLSCSDLHSWREQARLTTAAKAHGRRGPPQGAPKSSGLLQRLFRSLQT